MRGRSRLEDKKEEREFIGSRFIDFGKCCKKEVVM